MLSVQFQYVEINLSNDLCQPALNLSREKHSFLEYWVLECCRSFKNKVHIGFASVIINSSKELQRQLFRIIKLWLMYWQSYTLVFQTSTLNFILQWKNLKFIVMTFQCSFWTTMKSRTRMFCHKKPSGSHLCNDNWFFNLAHSKILLCK